MPNHPLTLNAPVSHSTIAASPTAESLPGHPYV